jgi:hypothetical protein
VVIVDVERGDAAAQPGLQVFRRDGGMVEVAESPVKIAAGMMPGRPGQGIRDTPGRHDMLRRRERRLRAAPGRFERLREQRRAGIERPRPERRGMIPAAIPPTSHGKRMGDIRLLIARPAAGFLEALPQMIQQIGVVTGGDGR